MLLRFVSQPLKRKICIFLCDHDLSSTSYGFSLVSCKFAKSKYNNCNPFNLNKMGWFKNSSPKAHLFQQKYCVPSGDTDLSSSHFILLYLLCRHWRPSICSWNTSRKGTPEADTMIAEGHVAIVFHLMVPGIPLSQIQRPDKLSLRWTQNHSTQPFPLPSVPPSWSVQARKIKATCLRLHCISGFGCNSGSRPSDAFAQVPESRRQAEAWFLFLPWK